MNVTQLDRGIPAKFVGTCVACQQIIEVGDYITQRDVRGNLRWVHSSCQTRELIGSRKRAVCPTCWAAQDDAEVCGCPDANF